MENAEEVLQFLEEFSKRKPKTIPQELNDYLAYVARTGDPVYQWALVKSLFKEKLLNVITDFYETSPGIDIPPYPNVDPFNYDIMKNSLLERLDSFTSAPFTVQRICELLTYPRKQYNRVDKFMRAIEKNILVVSTREPGHQRHQEPENGEPIVNGSDNNSEYNVDVEMEDMSWKESSGSRQSSEPQPGSSDAHITVDDLEARLQAKQENSMEIQDKPVTQYESVTPPELNVTETNDESDQTSKDAPPAVASTSEDAKNNNSEEQPPDSKTDIEMKSDDSNETVVIPEIKVDDAEMTEQKLLEQSKKSKDKVESTGTKILETKTIDESRSDSNNKEEIEMKHSAEMSSSEESSSSSDNTDGNSNSPKTDHHIDIQDETQVEKKNKDSDECVSNQKIIDNISETEIRPETKMQSDNYSITDLKSELPQGDDNKPQDVEQPVAKEGNNKKEEKEPVLASDSSTKSTKS
ncbi:unnamed protein product, partial [Brenthis ino]